MNKIKGKNACKDVKSTQAKLTPVNHVHVEMIS